MQPAGAAAEDADRAAADNASPGGGGGALPAVLAGAAAAAAAGAAGDGAPSSGAAASAGTSADAVAAALAERTAGGMQAEVATGVPGAALDAAATSGDEVALTDAEDVAPLPTAPASAPLPSQLVHLPACSGSCCKACVLRTPVCHMPPLPRHVRAACILQATHSLRFNRHMGAFAFESCARVQVCAHAAAQTRRKSGVPASMKVPPSRAAGRATSCGSAFAGGSTRVTWPRSQTR